MGGISSTLTENNNLNLGLSIVSGVLIIVLIVLVWVWNSSSCSVEDCSNLPSTLKYEDAVDKLQQLLEDNPENKDIFIANFFKQLKRTCVAKTT